MNAQSEPLDAFTKNWALRIKILQEDVSITNWLVTLSVGAFMFSFTNPDFKVAIKPMIETILIIHAIEIVSAVVLRVLVKYFIALVEGNKKEAKIKTAHNYSMGVFVVFLLMFLANYYMFLDALFDL